MSFPFFAKQDVQRMIVELQIDMRKRHSFCAFVHSCPTHGPPCPTLGLTSLRERESERSDHQNRLENGDMHHVHASSACVRQIESKSIVDHRATNKARREVPARPIRFRGSEKTHSSVFFRKPVPLILHAAPANTPHSIVIQAGIDPNRVQ